MKPGAEIITSPGTLIAMTTEQFEALKRNILSGSNWDTVNKMTILGSDPLTVCPLDVNGDPIMMIGIEHDGYTHS